MQAFREANPQVPLEKERVRLLLQGIASHHAGLLPLYKTLVEELFNANLIKVGSQPGHSLASRRSSSHCCCCWLVGLCMVVVVWGCVCVMVRWCSRPRRWLRA